MPQTRQYVCALYFIFYCYIELRELMGYLLLIVAILSAFLGSNLNFKGRLVPHSRDSLRSRRTRQDRAH